MTRRITSVICFVTGLASSMFLCWAAQIHFQAKAAGQDAPRSDSRPIAHEAERASAWKLLDDAAKDENGEKRAKMIHSLGLLGKEPKAVELAETALEDHVAEVRTAAARVLGEMGSTKSAPKLVAALSDKKISVALAAAHSLVAFKNYAGYEVYYEVITGKRKSGGMIEREWDELKDPKKAADLAFVQGIGFVPYAGAAFEAFRLLTKQDPSPIRASAASELASDPDPRSGAALTQAVRDKNWIVRVAALRAIAMRGDHESLDAVAAATQDKRAEVRFAAAAAVIRLTAQAG